MSVLNTTIGMASLGWSLFGVEAQLRTFQDVLPMQTPNNDGLGFVFVGKVRIPIGFWAFYAPLHRRYTPRQQALAAKRLVRLADAHHGDLPTHLPPSPAKSFREMWRRR